MVPHHKLAQAMTLIQIAISLASITVLTRKKWLFAIARVAALGGIGIMGYGFDMKSVLYDWFGLNVWLFHFINNIRSEFIDKVALLGTTLGSHTHFDIFIIPLIIIIYNLTKQNTHSFSKEEIYILLTPIIVLSVSYLIDALFLEIIKPLLDFKTLLLLCQLKV